ncbi:ester cyclase [Chitinophaga agrisoli]|uniref:Ester cyclase n=1 Tax=Chitinophaga agrisoli TaxID=2607653 RepID=A0A5B2W075_9BACT|nr:ester cyclase [Chitinophaga agrisoli]KAA2245453.1 ester cyclase [Chitinophaga agrisoli]
MSATQNNKEIIRNLYEQAMNQRNMGLLQELIADSYPGLQGQLGAAGFEGPIAQLIKAFPDIQWHIQHLSAEGDQVTVQWQWQGTHTGQYLQVAATGKKVSNDGMAIFTLQDGKIIKAQIQTDRLGFLQQLDVLPADPAALTGRPLHKDWVQFIDKFRVPAAGQQAFLDRVRVNRAFLKTLPGFVTDAAYTYSEQEGDLICVTVATWANQEALDKAKEAVQGLYKAEGFDPGTFFKRLGIVVDRGVYAALEER